MPLTPVIVRVEVPVLAPGLTATASVDVALVILLVSTTVVGLNVGVVLAGCPETLSPTDPVNPLVACT